MAKLRICVLGASGYTGVELIRILLRHENVVISALVAERNSGKILDIYPHFISNPNYSSLPEIVKISDVDMSEIDVVFCCLPHGTTQEVIKSLPSHIKIIDLSADFRLFNPLVYEKWYFHPHKAIELQKQVVFKRF